MRLRTGIAVAVICAVAAEMVASGVTHGLGYQVQRSYEIFRIDQMFAALLCLCAIGLCLDRAFVFACRVALPWIQWEA